MLIKMLQGTRLQAEHTSDEIQDEVEIEDKAVPALCITGMPIVGEALESPFFNPYLVESEMKVSELLLTAPTRREKKTQELMRFANHSDRELLEAIYLKTIKEVKAGTMAGPPSLMKRC